MKARLHIRSWLRPAPWRGPALLLGLGLTFAFGPGRAAAGDPQVLSWLGTTNAFLNPGVPYALGAVASSGLPVLLKVEAGPAVLASGTLTITGAGTVIVGAEQAGDAKFSAARITRRFNMFHAGFSEVTNGIPLPSASRIQVVGNHAFLTLPRPWTHDTPNSGDLRVLDITDQARPELVASVNLDGWIGSVEIAGGLACVAVSHRDGTNGPLPGAVYLLDITRARQPVLLGTFAAAGVVGQMRLVDGRLYLAEASWDDPAGGSLGIVDLSQPSNPIKLGSHGFGQGYSDLEIVGDTLYAADATAGFAIFDVRDPANPIRKDPGNLKGALSGVTVRGSLAYLTGTLDASGFVQVVDVSDASQPRLIRTLEMRARPEKVQFLGNHAYVLEALPPNKATPSFTRVHVLDIADPTDPVDVGFHAVPGGHIGFNILGGTLHLGLRMGYNSPPSPTDLPPVSIHFGLPQRLERRLPEWVPFVRSPITNLASSDTGLPVTYEVLSGPATVENGRLLLNGLGPVEVRARQAGDGTYVPAVDEWTFRVGPPQLGLRRSADGLEAVWPDGLPGLVLQRAASLPPDGAWTNVNAPRIQANGEERVRVATDDTRQFFRLQAP